MMRSTRWTEADLRRRVRVSDAPEDLLRLDSGFLLQVARYAVVESG